jgi:hypothetical protein
MRRISWLVAAVIAVGLVAWRAAPMLSGDTLLAYVPGRPLVTFYAAHPAELAEHVQSLLAAREYLQSKAREAYADSKLALKLADRAERLSGLAGMPLTLASVVEHAKHESVLALYDIGELEFLWLARLSPDEQAKLVFVAERQTFDQRLYDGRTYYARVDADTGAAFVFCSEGDLLLVASSPDLIEGALLARRKPDAQPRLLADPDYRRLTEIDPDIGQHDAVLFLDMRRLRDDRYFRVYWAWRNFADFAALDAVLVGFSCNGQTMTERRALLSPVPTAPTQALTYDGAGMSSFIAGGVGTTAQLRQHFGWDLAALGLDERTAARLVVYSPVADERTGLIVPNLGAALLLPGVEPAHLLQSLADTLAAQRPALAGQLKPRVEADGSASLSLWPGLPGAFARRQGEALLLANGDAFLKQLAAHVKPTAAGGLLRLARADGGSVKRVAEFLRQADKLGAIEGEGAEFAGGPLIDILQAAGSFQEMRASTTAATGGLRQETVWR